METSSLVKTKLYTKDIYPVVVTMLLGVSNQDARNNNLFLCVTIDDLCVIIFI